MATAWVLVVGLLLYPLLTYLATPLVQSHGPGQWTVMCTLQGEKAVFVEFGDASTGDPAACPALKLLQAFASASPSLPPALADPTRLGVQAAAPPASYPYHAPHTAQFASRAPPYA